jgi:hypothetical protein
MLNNINKAIMAQFAEIQNEVNATRDCSTLSMEIAHMVAGGKERIYLNQLAARLTGWVLDKATANVIGEDVIITVFPEQAKRSYKQSLNASIYMVASYAVLMNGYTSADILETALTNWLEDDKIELETALDCKAVAQAIITQFIKDGILESQDDEGQLDTGERFRGHPVTAEVQTKREETIAHMWATAPPKMKPMLHPVSWNTRGECCIPNLTFKEKVTMDFVISLNIMGHTGYKVNPQIRGLIKRKIKRGQYDADQLQAMKSFLQLDPMKVYYFPHTPDYRGRVYARGGLTTFQGVKDLRAAFDFAHSTKVDEYGLYLHIANACGFDKASIDDRIQWVRDNEQDLLTTPRSSLYAERARLAFVEYKDSGMTNIICRIDGTCSGVQVTSGLFLDAETGAAVNVGASTSADKPQDLYGLVADAALAGKGRASDKAMIKKYHRDITKQMIMILAYGAGERTLIDSVKNFLIDKKERHGNAKAIYKLIMDAITANYAAITKLNDNLQLELEELDLNKITYKLSDITVKLAPKNTEHLNLYGSAYTAKLLGKALPDGDALARGIAPNFVHSLDSELLRKAVRAMNKPVSCIHDDLGVQTGDVKEALQAVRTAYVEVIKAEPLRALYSAMGIVEEYELDREDVGELDLNDVLESAYLFS